MSPSTPDFHLWVATDDSRTVVALAPLKISGTPLKHEWGSLTHLQAIPAAQSSSKLGRVIVLCTGVLIGTLLLCLSSAPVLVILILMAMVLGFGLAAILSKTPPPHVVAPDETAFPELHHSLNKREEREEFLDLMGLTEQAGRGLPAVDEAIDPAEGGELLAQVLWEAADVLSRRQQLRPQVGRQQNHPARAGSPNSTASRSLAEQRERTRALWEQTEAELARIQTALELAAVSAHNAAHDPNAVEAVREAYNELADIYGERY
ncbi:hypothetical protein EAD89_15165 [Micromonospora sp. BL4]|uniref:hypothetical protein n=1 Tax=Micromonospora sp. BL4 TaxID=2478710 RepID=UPI000EF603A7|nr:hypothetical protein [Micromonospora sp. BL4]RLP89290.1 hypothetical protein EAD89_15165 [Micromonospora sp. BL4]